MEIKRKNEKIVVEFPLEKERCNPFMSDDAEIGSYVNLVGLVTSDDWGLARVIDMEYKGKPDQVGQIVLRCTTMSKEEFVNRCEELDLKVIE